MKKKLLSFFNNFIYFRRIKLFNTNKVFIGTELAFNLDLKREII